LVGLALGALALVAAVAAFLPWPSSYSAHQDVEPVADHACRFWGMIGSTPADSVLSDQLLTGAHPLMALAEENPDGWGIAFHAPSLAASGWNWPLILRAGSPADHPSDPRFRAAVERLLSLDACAAVAHVRNGTSGHTGIPDPHPFWHDEVVLVHNGTLTVAVLESLLTADDPTYLESHPPDYNAPRLDSELFLLYILKLRDLGVGLPEGGRSHALPEAVREATLQSYEAGAVQSAANCIALAADTLCAVRFDLEDAARYRVRYREIPGGWVVASEPVGTDTTAWATLPPKHYGIFSAEQAPLIASVFPPMAYPVIGSLTIDDDQTGESMGNGDGGCDAGESIELIVALRNDGGASGLNVRATLSTTDSLCQVVDDYEVFGDIPPGETVTCPDDYDVIIDPQCRDRHLVPFLLLIEADDRATWEWEFTLQVAAPVINYVTHEVEELGGGNSNGRIDPGENVALHVTLANSGGEHATGLEATLTIAHPWATVIEGLATLDTLPVGGAPVALPPFALSVDPLCPDPELLVAQLAVLADWEQTALFFLHLPVGGFFDDMEFGPGLWVHDVVTPGYYDQWHQSQHRNFTPGGEWSWKFGGPGGDNYTHLADGALVTEQVPLRPYAFLRFRHWMAAEISGSHAGYCYDGGMVEMSVNEGPWEQIHPVGSYPYLIRTGTVPGPWPGDTPVYSGDVDWESAFFEITGCEGLVRFRFRFGSDGATEREGWYIDDVEIYGTQFEPSATEGTRTLRLLPWLDQNRPNPFEQGTELIFELPSPTEVSLCVMSPEGRLVRRLVRGLMAAGRHTAHWDGCNDAGQPMASGAYLYRFAAGGEVRAGKMILTR